MERPANEITDALANTAKDVAELVKLHLSLMKADLMEETKRRLAGAGGLGAAAALAYAALLMLFLCGLALWTYLVPLWASALIMAGLGLLGAAAAGLYGLSKMRAKPLPRVREVLRDDARLLDERVRPA